MKGLLLRLLVVFMLFQSTFGILCYLCVTKVPVKDGIDEDREPPVLVGQEKGENVTAKPPPPHKEGGKVKASKIITKAHTNCKGEDGKGQDVKENWEEAECAYSYRACFFMTGTIVERVETSIIKFDITERGCFLKEDRFDNVTFEKDHRITATVESFARGSTKNLSGSAQVTVCDDLNGGEMLCNRGLKGVGIRTTFIVYVSIVILHFI